MHSPKDVLTVLPPDLVAKVKENEMSDPNRSRSYWTCGHCTSYLGNLKLREIVVSHLKSVYVSSFSLIYPSPVPIHQFLLFIFLFIRHGIDTPREPEDLFFFTRNQSLVTFEAGYTVDKRTSTSCVKTIRCLQCAKGKPSEQNRLFDIHGVKSHLSAK